MSDTILDVQGLTVEFAMAEQDDGSVRAVDNVSFRLERGQTIGIVGESKLPSVVVDDNRLIAERLAADRIGGERVRIARPLLGSQFPRIMVVVARLVRRGRGSKSDPGDHRQYESEQRQTSIRKVVQHGLVSVNRVNEGAATWPR